MGSQVRRAVYGWDWQLKVSGRVQAMLDRSTPFVAERWAVTAVIFVLFALSVVLRQGVSLTCRLF